MRTFRRMTIALALLMSLWIISSETSAQESGGQICIRAFEDRNGNGTQDTGEPLITRGISATLTNDAGVVVDSRFMEDSPNAAQGTLCFQRLPAGQYSVRVNSASYTATTDSEFVTAISATGTPSVFEFGGQVIAAAQPQTAAESGSRFQLSPQQRQAALQRILLSAGGALLAVIAMALIGVIIYFVFVRSSGDDTPPRDDPNRRVMTPVDDPRLGEEPPISDEDTGRMRSISEADIAASAAEDEFRFRDDATREPDAPRDDDTDAPYRPPSDAE